MFRYLALVPVLPITVAQEATAGPAQWGGNGHWYQPVSGSFLTWEEAYQGATDAGGYLVTITSAEENDFVFSLINDAEYWFLNSFGDLAGPWTGGVQPPGSEEPAGGWTWITGELFDFAAWASIQPNNATLDQDRIHFWSSSQIEATWQDARSTEGQVLSYVIEWSETFCSLADLDGDLAVGIGDFLLVLAQWGPCPPQCLADVDGDNTVGISDLLLVLANWGPCP